jgi:dTMP kinase
MHRTTFALQLLNREITDRQSPHWKTPKPVGLRVYQMHRPSKNLRGFRFAIIATVRHTAKDGRFLTFEGLDGCGKSTHVERLAAVLRAEGLEVVTTREPGGSEVGERIRGILLDSRTSGLAPLAELSLMFASRAQHISEVILPAVNRGAWVLCDRYTDSSEAYQGAGRQLGVDTVLMLHRVLCLNLQPDLTLLLDNDVATSLARARRRNLSAAATVDENRFEQENRAFFERVHQQYMAIARRDPERVVVIDARHPVTLVHEDIVAAVRRHLPLGRS